MIPGTESFGNMDFAHPIARNIQGRAIWQVILSIHGALQAIGYALLVLFFVVGIIKTCGSFTEVKSLNTS